MHLVYEVFMDFITIISIVILLTAVGLSALLVFDYFDKSKEDFDFKIIEQDAVIIKKHYPAHIQPEMSVYPGSGAMRGVLVETERHIPDRYEVVLKIPGISDDSAQHKIDSQRLYNDIKSFCKVGYIKSKNSSKIKIVYIDYGLGKEVLEG